jgi:hypothetical protein
MREAEQTYAIVRHYFNRPGASKTIRRGLSLEAARSYCLNPETSSMTATSASANAHTRRHGEWFDGYVAERRIGR